MIQYFERITHEFNQSLYGKAFFSALKAYLFIISLTSLVFLVMGLNFPSVKPPDSIDLFKPYNSMDSQTRLSRLLSDPWYRWDTVHYVEIAEDGYSANLKNTVWPPLYPVLIRLFSFGFINSLHSALIISNIACIFAFFLLYLFVCDCWDEKTASKTLQFLSFFPTAFFLVAGYTESLFLAISLGIFYALKKDNWWIVTVLAPLAVLTRFQGVILAIPILWCGLIKVKQNYLHPVWFIKTLSPLVLMLASFTGFSIYVHEALNARWPWVTLAEGWNQHIGLPWQGIVGNFLWLISNGNDFFALSLAKFFDLVCILVAIGALILRWKMIPLNQLLFALSNIFLILVKVDQKNLLVSASRYVLVIFPIFIALASGSKKIPERLWFGFSILSQVILITYFYWWGWVA